MNLKFTTRITNSHNSAVKLFIEPWGELYQLQAGASVDILVEGPGRGDTTQSTDAGLLEVEYSVDQITVWGWSGSKLEVVGASVKP
ncbi:MAG TPA: hypothetical protein VK539_38590 [Myxococcaceae bacterium]|nr:hypothetical protein [Myxococcaceae bacterium]